MANKRTFEFKIAQVIPVGLHGDGQRAIHTVLTGHIVNGSLEAGDALRVFLTDGSIYRALTKMTMLGMKGQRPRFISPVTADDQEFICDIAFYLHPGKAHLIDTNELAWSETATDSNITPRLILGD